MNSSPAPLYKRILLKISGEALQGANNFGISHEVISGLAEEIRQVHDLGVEIAIVTGGGNFFRGIRASEIGIDRANADYMGMLATVLNGIALRDALEKTGLETRLVSALEINKVAEPYVRRRAMRHLEENRIVIFSAGTGNPFFTTDTAAALRAIETEADIFLKATMVDGVFNADPKKVNTAVKYDSINYNEVIERDLKVMDHSAVILCKENSMKIKAFNLTIAGNIYRAITDKKLGTTIE